MTAPVGHNGGMTPTPAPQPGTTVDVQPIIDEFGRRSAADVASMMIARQERDQLAAECRRLVDENTDLRAQISVMTAAPIPAEVEPTSAPEPTGKA